MIEFTYEQSNLIRWGGNPHPTKRHAILEARAGTGKTTTILHLASSIVEYHPGETILVVAFNKRIAEEITAKAAKLHLRKPRFDVQTLHACGNSARMTISEYRRSTLNQHKVADLIGLRINALRRTAHGGNLAGKLQPKETYQHGWHDQRTGVDTRRLSSNVDPKEDPDFLEKHKMTVNSLVDFARLYGVGVSFQLEDAHVWNTIIQRHITLPRVATATSSRITLVPDLIHHASEIIIDSEKHSSNEHDFVDMLWLPILSGANFKKYDWVMIDEAQDTNELSRAIALASMHENSRCIVVGDPHQCINGFQGADDQGIAIMQRALDAEVFPLTISQRCSKAVIAHAIERTTCKDIKARADAPDGMVTRTLLADCDFSAMRAAALSEKAAVLCRNNAPLISLGFQLMKADVPFYIHGGADLYGSLLRLTNRWKSIEYADQLDHRLVTHRESEIARLRSMSAHVARIEAVTDEIDMLRTIIRQAQEENPNTTRTDIAKMISKLKHEQEVSKKRGLVLSTVHKSKGLEWDTVYILGADRLMPSRYATTDFDKSQEDHILYVAITRARHELIYIDYGAADTAELHDSDLDEQDLTYRDRQ